MVQINLNLEGKINTKLIAFIVVILGLQYAYINYAKQNDIHKKIADRIDYNLNNQKLIEDTIVKELKIRLEMLRTSSDNNSAKMQYNDWINYNNKNPFVYTDQENDRKYWIQVWRLIPDTNNESFQLKSYPDLTYLNHTWKDLINFNKRRFTSNHVETDEQLIKKFLLARENPYSIFQFYWYDPVFDKMVERKSVVMSYDDGFGNKGTISSGFSTKNMNKTYTFDHFNTPVCTQLYYGSTILTTMLALIIYSFNNDNPKLGMIKAGTFFLILTVYTTYYMTINDELGTVDVETRKLDSINQGILSMSFMTGLSIFILTNLKEKEAFLYKETSFLLITFMITIIIILFKNNAYIHLTDITEYRIFKEFIFNYCILINMFIIINFGINVFAEKGGI
jgi:hypothetical protein